MLRLGLERAIRSLHGRVLCARGVPGLLLDIGSTAARGRNVTLVPAETLTPSRETSPLSQKTREQSGRDNN